MNNKLNLAIACGIATMCVATTGFSAAHATKDGGKSFNIGGDVELDLTGSDAGDSSNFNHSGRIKLNAVGEAHGNNGMFVKGVAQPIVLFNPGNTAIRTQDDDVFVGNNAVEADDLYFQFGKKNVWDIQMGRFEAINLLPLGKDTIVANVAGIEVYNANQARGRRDDAFQAALHVGNADKFLFELGVQARKNGSDDKVLQIRPAMTYKFGNVKMHLGYENLDGDTNGVGIGAGFGVAGGTLNASYVRGQDFVNPRVAGSQLDVNTIAVNYTKGNWGVGVLTADAELENNPGRDPSLTTVYGAYTMPLLSIKDASVTFAASYSDGKDTLINTVTGDTSDDDLTAVRVRFNYTF